MRVLAAPPGSIIMPPPSFATMANMASLFGAGAAGLAFTLSGGKSGDGDEEPEEGKHADHGPRAGAEAVQPAVPLHLVPVTLVNGEKLRDESA